MIEVFSDSPGSAFHRVEFSRAGQKNNQACFNTLGHVYIFGFELLSTVGQNRNNADLPYRYGPFPFRSHCR